MADGSRIYPSGGAYHPVRPGMYFVWACVGHRPTSDGKRVREGEVLLGSEGVLYFGTPQEALNALEDYLTWLSKQPK